MLKKFLAAVAMFCALSAFAAVDVNKATASDLDGIKGIGPGISGKILDERKKGSFKDWPDFVARVKGVGEGNATKFSAGGLTVNGTAFTGAVPAAKKEVKSVKAEAKPTAIAPTATAMNTAPATPATAVAAPKTPASAAKK